MYAKDDAEQHLKVRIQAPREHSWLSLFFILPALTKTTSIMVSRRLSLNTTSSAVSMNTIQGATQLLLSEIQMKPSTSPVTWGKGGGKSVIHENNEEFQMKIHTSLSLWHAA